MKIKTIYTEITNQCNLNCATCYNRSGLNKEVKELSKEQIGNILKTFLPLGLNRFLLSGGEPTLHSEFEGILDFITDYPQLSFGIVTNGTNHNKKLIHLLNTCDNLTLQVSLDGSDEFHNAKTRGSRNYQKAVGFLQQLEIKDKKPLLKMVISQNNLEDVESFYRLALTLGCTPEFAFIYKSGNGAAVWEAQQVSPQDKLKVLKLVARLNQELDVQAFLPLCDDKCPFTGQVQEISPCIKVDGSIQPCQMLYDTPYTIGSLHNFSAETLDAGMERICRQAKARLHVDYQCGTCLLNGNCEKGCMASAVMLHGDPMGDDGECQFRKLQLLGYSLPPLLKSNTPQRNPL